MKQTLFILLMGCSLIQLHAQEEYRYFPTGMKWKEVIADPFSSLPLDTVYSVQYEIGEDTLVNDRLCKTILMDGKPLERWIIEENEKVWIFTNDYPDPIQIYDFNWNGDKPYYELLRVYDTSHETGGSSYQPELVRSYLNQDEIEVTSYNNHTIEYLMDFEGVVIRHIGRVSDMNRNSCLLGYKIVDPILPGLEFIKVLWIVRDGKEIFRSEDAEEWVVDIPSVINGMKFVEEGKAWILHQVDNSNPSREYTYYFQGDTIINQDRCLKMYYKEGNDGTPIPFGCWTEKNRKVYCYQRNSVSPELFYDFSLKVNEQTNIRGCNVRVLSIDTIVIRNSSYRCLLIEYSGAKNNGPHYKDMWIEGIGSAFTFQPFYQLMTGIGYRLLSCTRNGTTILTGEDFEQNVMNIMLSEKIMDNLNPIYDLQGRKVTTPQKNGLYIKNGKKFIAR